MKQILETESTGICLIELFTMPVMVAGRTPVSSDNLRWVSPFSVSNIFKRDFIILVKKSFLNFWIYYTTSRMVTATNSGNKFRIA